MTYAKQRNFFILTTVVWVQMELEDGGTIYAARKAYTFNENEISYVAKEILQGLEYMYSLGLMHRYHEDEILEHS